MRVSFENFLKLSKSSYQHHAFLLLSSQFDTDGLSTHELDCIAKQFCGMTAHSHSDIFIADRTRSILRLEDISPIREQAFYPPFFGFRRLFVIERCERMNLSAVNALLKVLEEPPACSLFVLTAKHTRSLPPTLVSRCQKFFLNFKNEKSNSDSFKPEDLAFIKDCIYKFSSAYFLNGSLSEPLLKEAPHWDKIKTMIDKCEQLAREYPPAELCGAIVSFTNERLKTQPDFLPLARFILANIVDWKNHENLNTSVQLWLTRIFLGFSL